MTSDDTRLVEAITGALSVSLRADEPNWSTQRNWDAGDGLVIRRHAEKVAAAIKEAGLTIIAPNPRTAWLYEDGPDPDPAAVAELKRMFEEERAAVAKRSSDPI